MRILGIHHVTLAVRDVEEACETFAALFGVDGGDRRAVPAFGIRATDVRFGDDVIEFASPIYPDNPLRRFLERKGEGFYALALEVDDIQAAVREMAAKGVRVSAPVESEPGIYSSFVTMTATHGISIQLVEVTRTASTPASANAPTPVATHAEEAPAAAPEATVVDAQADHLPPDAAAPDFRPPPLDLTPDEWSDTD